MDKFANLEAFVAVVETGSFSKASSRLGVAKSVVSRRVSALEQALGVQLLQRTTRSHSLTEPGRRFYEQAIAVLADLEEAEQSIVDDSAALRGTLRIAAPLSFGLRRLPPILAAFMGNHPGIELDLDLNDREVGLVEEGFHMALRIGDLSDSALLARRLGTARFVTCASPAYLAAHGTPGHPRELANHAGLHYANVPPARAWQFVDAHGDTIVSVPTMRMRANNGDMLAEAAVAGLGLLSSPTFIVSELIAAGQLHVVLQAYRRPAIGIHAVYPPGRLMTRRVQAFADFLADRIGDLPAWDRAIGIGV